MTSRLAAATSALALFFALGGCSADPGAIDSAAPASTSDAVRAPDVPGRPIVGLEGLGGLRVGQPVPEGSGWAERGAQISDECRTISSPDHPGIYAIVIDGQVRRITVGQRSDLRLAEGPGIGASEQEVRRAFAGLREEPHKYEEAPAKYLTGPNAARGEPALRFEIGRDGRVSLIHFGIMPELEYVEGCA